MSSNMRHAVSSNAGTLSSLAAPVAGQDTATAVPAFSLDPSVRARTIIEANRVGSGWNTLELKREDLDPSELPIDNPLLPGGDSSDAPRAAAAATDTHSSPADCANRPQTRHALPTRLVSYEYEFSRTAVFSRSALHEYHQQREELERRAAQEAASGVKQAGSELVLEGFEESRLRPLIGLVLIMACLLGLGWMAARSWPQDIQPSVKVMLSR